MREIKFRGQRQSDNKWIYGDLLQPIEICDIYEISDCESIDGSRYDVIKDTIGQYTGLKDKNGKEIYEGDIVEEVFFNKKYDEKERRYGKYIVKYDEYRAGYVPFACGDGCGCCESEVIKVKNTEVIGNIYDNPELLEV